MRVVQNSGGIGNLGRAEEGGGSKRLAIKKRAAVEANQKKNVEKSRQEDRVLILSFSCFCNAAAVGCRYAEYRLLFPFLAIR